MDDTDMDDAITVTMPSGMKAEVERRQTKGNAKWVREAIQARFRDEDRDAWVQPDEDYAPERALPDGGTTE